MYEVQSKRNITPLLRSMSMATSLVLIHENPHLGSVDHFDVLEDLSSGHVPSASSQGQLVLPDVVLYLPQLLILPLQLLVYPVTLDLGQSALVIEVVYCTVDLQAEVVVVFEELKLTRGISAEWPGGREGGHLKGFDVLVGVSVYHTIHKWVFTIFELDIFRQHEFTTWKTNVKQDVVGAFVQLVAWWDLWSWAIIFPSNPLVSLLPFVGWSSSAICS